MMRLRVLLPDEVLVDTQARQVSAEGMEGPFTLLPRHIDYVSALVPGLLSYVTQRDSIVFLAVDTGILVKRGHEVRVSVRNAVRGADLHELHRAVKERFMVESEHEQRAHTALVTLEMDLIRRFIELGD